MKASELMQGDLVLYEYKGERFTTVVREIYKESVLVEEIALVYKPVEIPMQDIYPIPLTPEILEKNGWRSRMNGTGEFYLTKPLVDEATVTKNIIGFQMNHGPFCGLSIHYVHELQHAIRLCGIEKEIEL